MYPTCIIATYETFTKTTALKQLRGTRNRCVNIKIQSSFCLALKNVESLKLTCWLRKALFILLRNNEWDTYLNGKVHQRIFHLLKTYHIKKSTDAICRSHFASFRVRPSNVTELYNKKGMMMTILYQVNWNTTSQRKKKRVLLLQLFFSYLRTCT